MAKFLLQASYLGEGAKGLLREGGSGRRAAIEEAVASVGGRVESMYFTFGDHDVCLVVDFPDNVSSSAFSLTARASGLVSTSTTPLLTVEEIDEAARKSVRYRAPGT
ncbi:GYD domain-containing protein [Gandjariella thermophila]|uniref:GYD domain-containing protein n=1 Tax=Gandjariella thermophila TaxID=1931992 RepID=A0A4D4J9I1_9PSEU|nr:GYD domain-containing protein [Gandjariella thermophila]GDY32214.1 hypothetical protein GTS_38470 [Gandjariella thermophila]